MAENPRREEPENSRIASASSVLPGPKFCIAWSNRIEDPRRDDVAGECRARCRVPHPVRDALGLRPTAFPGRAQATNLLLEAAHRVERVARWTAERVEDSRWEDNRRRSSNADDAHHKAVISRRVSAPAFRVPRALATDGRTCGRDRVSRTVGAPRSSRLGSGFSRSLCCGPSRRHPTYLPDAPERRERSSVRRRNRCPRRSGRPGQ